MHLNNYSSGSPQLAVNTAMQGWCFRSIILTLALFLVALTASAQDQPETTLTGQGTQDDPSTSPPSTT